MSSGPWAGRATQPDPHQSSACIAKLAMVHGGNFWRMTTYEIPKWSTGQHHSWSYWFPQWLPFLPPWLLEQGWKLNLLPTPNLQPRVGDVWWGLFLPGDGWSQTTEVMEEGWRSGDDSYHSQEVMCGGKCRTDFNSTNPHWAPAVYWALNGGGRRKYWDEQHWARPQGHAY